MEWNDKEYIFYAWISNGSAEIHSNTGIVHTESLPVIEPEITSVSAVVVKNSVSLTCTYKGTGVSKCGFVLLKNGEVVIRKNASIGVASTAGKANIHSVGITEDAGEMWNHIDDQDGFLESMAAAAQAVHNYFNGRVIYINVMNNMSVDCDCDGHPAKPELQDMGIMASLDPVAVDQACLDMVFNYKGKPGDDNKPLIERINRQHGTYITEYAEQIGLGSKAYTLVNLDER